MNKKISLNFWNKCTEIEKKYISSRAETDGIAYSKEVVIQARKQIKKPYFLFGYGCAEDTEKNVYRYSGSDTKKFNLILNN